MVMPWQKRLPITKPNFEDYDVNVRNLWYSLELSDKYNDASDSSRAPLLLYLNKFHLSWNSVIYFYRWYPADIYLFKVNNANTRTICEISSPGVFVVNFEQISHIVEVFPLLILNK